jgi:hypothetical protein
MPRSVLAIERREAVSGCSRRVETEEPDSCDPGAARVRTLSCVYRVVAFFYDACLRASVQLFSLPLSGFRPDERPIRASLLLEREPSPREVFNNLACSTFTQDCGVDLDQNKGGAIRKEA